MSLQRTIGTGLISPEEYVANQAKIEQARKALEDMEHKNRVGLRKFAEAEREQQRIQAEILRQKQTLERKVQEGLEAQRLIQELEKQQLLALAPGSGVHESNYSNARIEEVPYGQQGQYDQYSSRNAQSPQTSHSNFSSYPQNQSLPPPHQQPQPQHGIYPPPRWQGSEHSGLIPANPTMQYQYPPSSQVPNIRPGQRDQSQYASTSQQVHNNDHLPFHHDTPPAHQESASSFTSQSIPNSSQGSFVAPYHPGSWHFQQQQPPQQLQQQPQNSNFQPYQPYSVKTGQVNVPVVSNELRNQIKPMATGVTSPPNLSSQPSTSIPAVTTNYAESAASQMEQNRQIPVQSQYIDALGVPFLSITDQEISSLRKRADEWILHASPGSRNQLHEMLILYKDTHATNPTSWIYVPWEPGSLRYARTHEIDRFFATLAANAKLVASGALSVPKKHAATSHNQLSSAQQPIVPTSVVQNNPNSINIPAVHPATRTAFNGQNLVPVTNNQNKIAVPSSATARTNKTPTTFSTSIQAPIGSPITNHTSNPTSSTNGPTGLSVTSSTPTSTPSSVQAPTSPSVAVPSGLTRNLPNPSQVDKKHLTKHILFALGKRSRPSSENSSSEQPAKRHAAEAASAKHDGIEEPTNPSSNVAELSSRPALQNAGVQPSASTDALPLGRSPGITATPLKMPLAPHAPAPDIRPTETSSIPDQAAPGSPSIAPTFNPRTLHFCSADTELRQQSVPSIAAARPDLIQPTPVPATAVQMDTRTTSSPLATTSSSRFSVPPIETLDFVTAVETQSAGSTIASAAHSATMAASVGSEPIPAVKDGDAIAVAAGPSTAALQPSSLMYRLQNTTSPISTETTTTANPQTMQTMQTSWRLNAPKPTTTTPKPAATQYPRQLQIREIPTAGSSISNINPYSWLLSNRSQPQASSLNAPQSGSFSYDQITHNSFRASTSTATSKSTSTSKATLMSKEPLFLPSSSPDSGPSSRSAEKTKRGKRKEVMAYVLVPKANYPIRRRQRLEEKGVASEVEETRNRLKGLRTQSSSVSTSVVGEEVWDNALSTENWRDSSTTDPAEGEAVRLAYSRLQELPCRWDGCDVRLNSVNKLVEHLRQHKPQNQHFTCRWTQCGRRCTSKDVHLENHALLPLKCAYQNCSESYRTPSQLVKHFNAKHTNGTLKPSAEFFKPDLIEAPPVPGSIPAYLFTTELTKPATISPERHQVLCRLVVQNIVNSDQEKPTRRTKKTAKPSNNHTLAMGHDYEFIKTRSTRYSSYLSQAVDLPLEDLESDSVTRMVDEGLMLWGSEGDGTDMVAADADAEGRTPVMSPTGKIKIEMGDAVLRATDATDIDRHHHEHSTDEDAVEVMLTEVTA